MLALILDNSLGDELQRYPLSYFHKVSRAVGPSRQSGVTPAESAEEQCKVRRRISSDRAVSMRSSPLSTMISLSGCGFLNLFSTRFLFALSMSSALCALGDSMGEPMLPFEGRS